MKRLIKIFSIILVTFCLITFLAVNHQLTKNMEAPLVLSKSDYLTIDAGKTVNRFSQELKEMGWIKTRFWLRLYVRLNPEYAALKQGTYLVSRQETLQSLLDKIVSGREHQFSLTFIEGSTLKEWLVELKKQPYITKTKHTDSQINIAEYLGIKQPVPEGWFFPDTYAYTAGTKDIEILSRAYQKMTHTLEDVWQSRAVGLPYTTPYQALIMASIIEKETGKISEQPRISSVFVNRLNKKMRLQTDPTVIYGLGDRYQGDITRAHLKEKTAYNTYRINGLPPTPIAMPGLTALNAALNPEQSDYFYFVSMGNGAHKFSKTLTEHNLAVTKYQLK